MSDFELPDDLAHVERMLATSRLGEPPAGLRRRVQKSIRLGIQSDSLVHVPDSASAWSFFVGLAAAIAVWANLSFSALNQGVTIASPVLAPDVDRQTALLVELTPELSRDEARRQVLLLSSGLRWSAPRLKSSDFDAKAH